MSAEVFCRAKGLQGDWIVDVWESRGGEIEVLVEPPRESLRCRSCRTRRVHVHERKRRSWKDTPFAGQSVLIVMQSPRVHCLNCGAKTWHQPKFARGQKRSTKNFDSYVCGGLSRVTIQDVVETWVCRGTLRADQSLQSFLKTARADPLEAHPWNQFLQRFGLSQIGRQNLRRETLTST